jgi:hypothetical protein
MNNIVSGLGEICSPILKLLTKSIFKSLNSFDIRIRVPNIEKLSTLGYIPKISLQERIVKTIDWYRSINS